MEIRELTEKLLTKNVNDFTEKKNDLTYLSWANAWQEFIKIVPNATYEVVMFDDGKGCKVPYCGNGALGYMVFTRVTACGITRECYLPVMDNNNKTMKDHVYTYKTKSGDRQVDQISMFDVNKAIMRCLAKNLAMFGLGLYVYTGDDLPIEDYTPITEDEVKKIKELKVNVANTCRYFKVNSIEELTSKQAQFVIAQKLSSTESK